MSNKKNVKSLPEEFKEGFTIFYVTNIDQLFSVCFDSDSQHNYNHLLEKGVEIEQFETDSFMSNVLDSEFIKEDNLLEKLA